jgi:hypothetical protein
MRKLLTNVCGLVGVLGLIAWLLKSSHASQVNEARIFYKRTNDINKTIKLYPNVPLDSIKGQ